MLEIILIGKKKKKQLQSILKNYKNKSENNWDCIIPVSGGKDSTYQVVTALEYGMNPLCVNSKDMSPIKNRKRKFR